MSATWSLLPLGIQRECATEGCGHPAAYEMEAGNVASNYCPPCRERIEARENERSLREVIGDLQQITTDHGVSFSVEDMMKIRRGD